MTKEGFISNITQKLHMGEQLKEGEIRCVIAALREANDCFQEPYYEVIYHDKFDNTEHRIMEPVSRRVVDPIMPESMVEEASKWSIVEDHFDLRFRRMERKEDK